MTTINHIFDEMTAPEVVAEIEKPEVIDRLEEHVDYFEAWKEVHGRALTLVEDRVIVEHQDRGTQVARVQAGYLQDRLYAVHRRVTWLEERISEQRAVVKGMMSRDTGGEIDTARLERAVEFGLQMQEELKHNCIENDALQSLYRDVTGSDWIPAPKKNDAEVRKNRTKTFAAAQAKLFLEG